MAYYNSQPEYNRPYYRSYFPAAFFLRENHLYETRGVWGVWEAGRVWEAWEAFRA